MLVKVIQAKQEAVYASALCVQAKPELRIESPMLCRALFETFLGSESVVPDARAAWAAGARSLLASEQVRRDTRKSGS